ncbi:hypothetical protein ACGFWI_01040 [Streptomyces sp. NPDC048434]|uniref:hypothetical protein n=1 Tax=Streptomyces sp. NPDC048434 TaxID=3365549 RepID=UPI0037170058
MNDDERCQLIYEALDRAVAKDAAGAADALSAVGENSDNHQMYGVCCGIAAMAVEVMTTQFGMKLDPDNGDLMVIEPLFPNATFRGPAEAFSMRFIVAYANGDKDTALALYKSAGEAGPEQFTESVSSLLADTAGITRLALDQQSSQ